MKHPSREAWIAHVYRELPEAEAERLGAHLAQCSECRAEVGGLRNAMKSLDAWKIGPLPATRVARPATPGFKWAAAAAILALGVTIGVVAARAGSAALDRAELRKELQREMQSEMEAKLKQQRQEILTAAGKLIDERRSADNRATMAAIDNVAAEHVADFDSLHADLETVALTTERSLQQTHQQILGLASYVPPTTRP
jgi:uncharacterized membrane-anchored protein YhcB (DUF1043 family)